MEDEKELQKVSDGRKFALGGIYVTPAADRVLTITEMTNALQRHVRGDWGVVESDDWDANDLALYAGDRLLSVYQSTAQLVFWIITEWDRKSTTILLPSGLLGSGSKSNCMNRLDLSSSQTNRRVLWHRNQWRKSSLEISRLPFGKIRVTTVSPGSTLL